MLNEKLQKAIENTVEGIIEQAITYDSLDLTIDCILNEDGIYRTIEDDEGDDIDNPDYEEKEKEVRNAILNDEKLQMFGADFYAYEGQFKTLNVAIICSKEFDNPFDAMKQEM